MASTTPSDWDQVVAAWRASGSTSTIYLASVDVSHGTDEKNAKQFLSNAWLYFNRPAGPLPKWTEVDSAHVARPLRWSPITAPAGIAGHTILLAGILPSDDEAKHEFDRVDDELRALATHLQLSTAFRFRLQLCKLMAQLEAGALPASAQVVVVPTSWKTRHPIAAAITSIPAKIAAEISSIIHPSSTGESSSLTTPVHRVDAKAVSEVKGVRDDVIKKTGASFMEAIGLTKEDHEALLRFKEVIDSGSIPNIKDALAKETQKDPQLLAAIRKLLAADVGGGIMLPWENEEHESKAKGWKHPPATAEAATFPTPTPPPADASAQTRRIQGPSDPPVPGLAMVNPSELSSRITTSVYQWATQFLICPRIQPTTSWWSGQPNGVPSPENVSALSLFGLKGLINVATHPIPANWVPATKDLFKTWSEIPQRDGLGKQFPTTWMTDEWFVKQRLEGCNAMTIQVCTKLPPSILVGLKQSQQVYGWTDAQRTAEESKLASLIAAGNLYMCDYSNTFRQVVGSPPTSSLPTEPLKRVSSISGSWLSAPIALFQLDRVNKTFIPVAIQVESDITAFPNSNIVYMQDPANGWMWRYAKTCFASADWNDHEIGSHLTKTHLCIEVIAVSMHRNFDCAHPLYQLMLPHFVNTMSLNYFARSTLVPDVISSLSPLGLQGALDYSTFLYYNQWDIRAIGAPDDLKIRGFNPDTIDTDLPGYYCARDSLALWKMLNTFVGSCVALSYPPDTDGKNPAIVADIELQAWVNELKTQLGKGFPDISTAAELTTIVTKVIYTAAVTHSAVNYLQDYYFSYMPNAPPLMRQVPPVVAQIPKVATDRDTYYSQYLFASLPDKTSEAGQDAVVDTLSQPAPTDYTLRGFAASKAYQTNDMTAWMNAARKALLTSLDAYDNTITGQNRPAPGYNILRATQAATSIRI